MPADPAAPIHPSQQLIETLWEDGQVRLSRCWLNGGPSTVLVVAPCHDHPPAAIVKRLEQEYALRSELEPHWAVRPLELRREGGGIRLVLSRFRLVDQRRGLAIRCCLRFGWAVHGRQISDFSERRTARGLDGSRRVA